MLTQAVWQVFTQCLTCLLVAHVHGPSLSTLTPLNTFTSILNQSPLPLQAQAAEGVLCLNFSLSPLSHPLCLPPSPPPTLCLSIL